MGRQQGHNPALDSSTNSVPPSASTLRASLINNVAFRSGLSSVALHRIETRISFAHFILSFRVCAKPHVMLIAKDGRTVRFSSRTKAN